MLFDETSLKPLFVQIAEWVEDEILKGNMGEESQIPSTNQFAAQWQINPATAGKGINMLVDEGIIYKKRGVGMFVTVGAKEKVKSNRKNKFMEESLRNFILEAKNLGISKSELIEFISNIKE